MYPGRALFVPRCTHFVLEAEPKRRSMNKYTEGVLGGVPLICRKSSVRARLKAFEFKRIARWTSNDDEQARGHYVTLGNQFKGMISKKLFIIHTIIGQV
jgi:hypothetical protein